MRTHFSYPVATVVLSSVLLSGCFATGGDSTRTQAEGAGFGALLGAGIGAALGGDAKSTAIGAAIGGLGGFVLGNEIAKRKQKYKTQEDLIAGESAHLATVLRDTQAVNKSLSADIKSYRRDINSLNAKLKQGKTQQARLKEKKAEIDKRYANAQKSLQAVNNELETTQALHKEAHSKADKGSAQPLNTWNSRINQLKAQKVQLEKNTQQLQAVSNTIAL